MNVFSSWAAYCVFLNLWFYNVSSTLALIVNFKMIFYSFLKKILSRWWAHTCKLLNYLDVFLVCQSFFPLFCTIWPTNLGLFDIYITMVFTIKWSVYLSVRNSFTSMSLHCYSKYICTVPNNIERPLYNWFLWYLPNYMSILINSYPLIMT